MKKLAMVGCGGIGRYHLDHFLQYKDVQLAGFCDLISERAEAFAKEAGGKAYTDYKQMLDEIAPDMLFVCVPPSQHGDIEMEAISRGIHLFVEKPVALDLPLAKKIRDEIKKAGLISAVGFQLRYDNIVPPAQAYAKANEIVYMHMARIGGMPGVDWWRQRKLSGGQIVEQTIHQYDMIRFIYGEPDTVFTMGARGFVKGVENYDTEDASVTVVRFENGALATLSTGCYAEKGEAFDSKITFGARDSRTDFYAGSKMDLYGASPTASGEEAGTVFKGDGGLSQSQDGAQTIKSEVDYGALCDRTFVDAVISSDPGKILSPYEDAVKTLAFTLACNQSMDSNAPVKVDLT